MDPTSASVVRTIPVLGRELPLGSLYSIYTGETGKNPIDDDFVSVDESVRAVRTDICPASEKYEQLGLTDELRLDVLLEPRTVSGSANVLRRHEDECTEQVLLIFTSISEQKSVDDSYGPGEGEKFTHRIISTLFGARVIMFFEVPKKSVAKNATKLIDLVRKIPQIESAGHNAVQYKFNSEERALCHDVKCSVFSDVPFQEYEISDVTDMSQAIDLYHRLGRVVTRSRTVPLSVEISQIARIAHSGMSRDLVKDLCDVVTQLDTFLKQCATLGGHKILRELPSIANKIYLYERVVESLEANFTSKIRDDLIQAKRGKLEEEQLKQTLIKIQRSPFSASVLKAWLIEQKNLVYILEGIEEGSKKGLVLRKEDASRKITTAETKYTAVIYLGATVEEKELLTSMADFTDNTSPAIRDLAVYPGSAATLNDKLCDLLSLAEITLTTCIVTDELPDSDMKRQIRIFEKGELLQDDYTPPCTQKKPEVSEVHHDRVVITSKTQDATIFRYRLHVNRYSEEAVRMISLNSNLKQLIVDRLQPATIYQVRIQYITILGASKISPETEIVTAPCGAPTKPLVLQVSDTTCFIQWRLLTEPVALESDFSWEVESRNDAESVIAHVPGKESSLHMELKSNRRYVFRIRGIFVTSHGQKTYKSVGEYSARSEPFEIEDLTPLQIYKTKIVMKDSTLTLHGCPSIYTLKLTEEYKNDDKRLRRLSFGPPYATKPMKTILFVGATGAGKSTLINALANYLLGVQFDDEYRFRIVDEDFHANQAHSQTKWVTAYVMYHQATFPEDLPFSLTIVDTPGFGDVDGIEADKKITEQLSEYFHATGCEGIDSLDTIGFVAQAALSRLTPTQQYIFESILGLFGNDVTDNIFAMITFCDGQRPPLLEALNEANIPYTHAFKFNNSALFAQKSSGEATHPKTEEEDELATDRSFDQNYWAMGASSYKRFFVHLSKTQAISLVLTNQVLDEREHIEARVVWIQQQIRLGLEQQDNLYDCIQTLSKHKIEMKENKDFTVDVKKSEIVQIPLTVGTYVTNCLTCNMTCHFPCKIADDEQKNGCAAMNNRLTEEAACNVCPKGCHWSIHRNMPERLEIQTTIVRQTVREMKRKYEEASKHKLTTVELIDKFLDEAEALEVQTIIHVDEVRSSLKRLSEMALRPQHMTTVDYIDAMIQTEERTVSPGWKNRVKQLNVLRDRAETIRDIAQHENVREPWKEIRELIHQEQCTEIDVGSKTSIWDKITRWILNK